MKMSILEASFIEAAKEHNRADRALINERNRARATGRDLDIAYVNEQIRKRNRADEQMNAIRKTLNTKAALTV
ncbi:hypothetical protein IV38_GL000090 [Lactobacillus selangorensis]|uniref:Uncharacterized protein n=1 Tax=Lactobacillus selangorensis TaxID=81857 RepID=A0A0R2FVD4_9LACO|nr:hypothetical protein [Lactobacillus selangorensis]KRN29210.1 hypothetical protein IV38_GL000090 [Lactobacillus selangorensis]KRN31432.1 hypothetical protein IV40_GL001428 [Lactobacillus selangorensis]